jgi:hypothetical protein
MEAFGEDSGSLAAKEAVGAVATRRNGCGCAPTPPAPTSASSRTAASRRTTTAARSPKPGSTPGGRPSGRAGTSRAWSTKHRPAVHRGRAARGGAAVHATIASDGALDRAPGAAGAAELRQPARPAPLHPLQELCRLEGEPGAVRHRHRVRRAGRRSQGHGARDRGDGDPRAQPRGDGPLRPGPRRRAIPSCSSRGSCASATSRPRKARSSSGCGTNIPARCGSPRAAASRSLLDLSRARQRGEARQLAGHRDERHRLRHGDAGVQRPARRRHRPRLSEAAQPGSIRRTGSPPPICRSSPRCGPARSPGRAASSPRS